VLKARYNQAKALVQGETAGVHSQLDVWLSSVRGKASPSRKSLQHCRSRPEIAMIGAVFAVFAFASLALFAPLAASADCKRLERAGFRFACGRD
jgi:hypothetical protein